MKFLLPFRRLPSRPATARHRSARPRLEALERRDLLATVNWANPLGGDWNTASNWSGGALPGAGDDVIIGPIGGTVTHSSGTHSVHSLTSAANFVLSGGSLTLAGLSTLNSKFTLSGGTLTERGELDLNDAFNWMGGTLAGHGTTIANAGIALSGGGGKTLSQQTLYNAGTATWTGGGISLTNSAVWNNLSMATFDAQTAATLSGGTFNNAGMVLKSAGAGTTALNARFNNDGTVDAAFGTLALGGGGVSGGGFTVEGSAVLNFSGGTGTLTASSTVGGAGNVGFTGGSTTLLGAYTVTGDTAVANGTVNFNSDVTLTTLTLSNGTLTGAGTVTVNGLLTWTGGTMSGGGATVANGGIAVSGTSGKTLSLRTLDNVGVATWTGTGNITFSTHAVWNNLDTGLLDIRNDASLGGAQTTINNAGTIRKSAGTATSTITAALNNVGTVDAASGTLSLNGGGVNYATFSAEAGGVFQFGGGDMYLTAAGTLPNDLTIAGGAVFFESDVTLSTLALSGGSLTGTATVTVTGPIAWTGGTMTGGGTTNADGGIVFSGSADKHLNERTLNNAATTTVTGTGNVELVNNAVFNNLDTGALDFQNDDKFGTFSIFNTPGTINNAGLVQKSAGSGLTNLDLSALNNTGTVDAQSGTLALSGGGLSSGTFLTEPGATLEFGGGAHYLTADSSVGGAGNVLFGSESFNDLFITLAGSYAVGGTTTVQSNGGGGPSVTFTTPAEMGALTLVSGTLGGDGDLTTDGLLTWTGGTLSGNGQVNANGGLAISGTVNKSLSGRALVNAGAATWGGAGSVTFSNGASFDNAATGTFDVQTDATFGASGAVLTNEGTFTKSLGAGTATLNGNFTNSGTLAVGTGTLALGGDLENDGEADVHGGTTLRVNGLFIQFAGATNLGGGTLTVTTGDSLLDLEGGVLNGPGTINANVLNAARINVGGDGTVGLLTLNGSFTQTAAGVLAVDLGGTAVGTGYDQLHVSGSASLDGTLSVHLVAPFSPTLGDTFAVLSYSSRSGDFATRDFPTLSGSLFLVENLGPTLLTLETHS
jgi:hypothetical protein